MIQVNYLFFTLTLILIILYFFMVLFLKNSTPLMVVMSRSMEPTLQRGDLIIVSKRHPLKLEVGKIIVYKSKIGRDIIHRIVEFNETGERVKIITQGDSNQYSNTDLVDSEDVIGLMIIKLPKLGYPIYLLNS